MKKQLSAVDISLAKEQQNDKKIQTLVAQIKTNALVELNLQGLEIGKDKHISFLTDALKENTSIKHATLGQGSKYPTARLVADAILHGNKTIKTIDVTGLSISVNNLTSLKNIWNYDTNSNKQIFEKMLTDMEQVVSMSTSNHAQFINVIENQIEVDLGILDKKEATKELENVVLDVNVEAKNKVPASIKVDKFISSHKLSTIQADTIEASLGVVAVDSEPTKPKFKKLMNKNNPRKLAALNTALRASMANELNNFSQSFAKPQQPAVATVSAPIKSSKVPSAQFDALLKAKMEKEFDRFSSAHVKQSNHKIAEEEFYTPFIGISPTHDTSKVVDIDSEKVDILISPENRSHNNEYSHFFGASGLGEDIFFSGGDGYTQITRELVDDVDESYTHFFGIGSSEEQNNSNVISSDEINISIQPKDRNANDDYSPYFGAIDSGKNLFFTGSANSIEVWKQPTICHDEVKHSNVDHDEVDETDQSNQSRSFSSSFK